MGFDLNDSQLEKYFKNGKLLSWSIQKPRCEEECWIWQLCSVVPAMMKMAWDLTSWSLKSLKSHKFIQMRNKLRGMATIHSFSASLWHDANSSQHDWCVSLIQGKQNGVNGWQQSADREGQQVAQYVQPNHRNYSDPSLYRGSCLADSVHRGFFCI